MMTESPSIEVHEAGEHTVVRFNDQAHWDDDSLCEVWNELEALIESRKLQSLSFDLGGVELLPNDILSLLTVLWNRGLAIRLLNPSVHVREKLSTTRLDRVLEIVDVE